MNFATLGVVPILWSASERESSRTAAPASLPLGRTSTVKLYYSPGSCSLAPHIVARELGIELELVKVDLATKRLENGDDFLLVNPKGSVPALALDSGELLTETAVILTYLSDLRPDAEMTNTSGFDRYRLHESLNFVATELHKTIGLLFNPQMQQQSKDAILAILTKKLDFLNAKLERSDYLVGSYSIADAYAFTVLSWTKFLKIELAPWPHVRNYRARIRDRPRVQAALAAEGLLAGAA